MEAIVLAGGFGTRLRHVVPGLPKPMAPINGRPFLEVLLTSLSSKGFSRVVLSLGFMSEKIINHFGGSYAGMSLIYEIEDTPLGTGGAIRAALQRCVTDHVFVFNGDTYLDLDVERVERLWRECGQPIIVVRRVPDTSRFGRVEVKDGRVIEFGEKTQSGDGFINAGCYVLPVSILDSFGAGQNFSLESDFLVNAVRTMRFDGFASEGRFIDIGVPEDYARAQFELIGL